MIALRKISALSDMKILTEIIDTPPHPLIQTFSIPEIIERLNHCTAEFSGTVRQKIST